jgi:hypothetical protein
MELRTDCGAAFRAGFCCVVRGTVLGGAGVDFTGIKILAGFDPSGDGLLKSKT